MLFTNLLILVLGGLLFYFMFQYIIDRDIYNTLKERKEFARRKLSVSDSLYYYQLFSANIFAIKKISRPFPLAESLKDTVIFDPLEDQKSLFRQLSFQETFREQAYQITVRRPLIDRIQILQGILLLLLLLTIVLVVALYFANRRVSRKLWQPFYLALERLRTYRLAEKEAIHFQETDVKEFDELQQALIKLITRIHTDYYALKEYTENTTHEIQTPLAIIRSKLELLQETDLSHEQLRLVTSANQAVSRLSRLKEALLLLVRIKNRQYVNPESLPMKSLLQGRLAYFQELMEMKEIRLHQHLTGEATLLMNPVLAEILVDNLISNAIKHNVTGGIVAVELTDTHLTIRNTGEPPRVPTATLFDRFMKADPASKSLGLGLPIIQAICETNRIQIDYQFQEEYHQITILFPATDSLEIRPVLLEN